MTFSDTVRDELAHVSVSRACCRQAETAALLRFGGTLHRRGGAGSGFGLAVESTSGAVIRRLHQSLRSMGSPRPELSVREPGGLDARPVVRLVLGPDARPLLHTLGVLDAEGRPATALALHLAAAPCDRTAFVRGALLATGSVSEPRRDPHLELTVAQEAAAADLVRLLVGVGATGARCSAHRERWRVVVKGGAQVAEVLARTGAHSAFFAYEEGRLRRELRGAANRAANADRANLGRTVGASTRQAEAIQQVVDRAGWDGIPEDLLPVALARLANPEASLSELGALADPPLGKSAVHRRLQRLLALADGEGPSAPQGESERRE